MIAAAAAVLRVRKDVRSNNSSASVDAMVVRNVLRAAEDHSRNVRRSNSDRRSNRLRHRKPRESGRDGVAAVAAGAGEKSPLRIQAPPPRSSRGHRASRVLPARRRPRVRIRNPERRVPRAKAQNDVAASAVAGGAVAGLRKARNCRATRGVVGCRLFAALTRRVFRLPS